RSAGVVLVLRADPHVPRGISRAGGRCDRIVESLRAIHFWVTPRPLQCRKTGMPSAMSAALMAELRGLDVTALMTMYSDTSTNTAGVTGYPGTAKAGRTPRSRARYTYNVATTDAKKSQSPNVT